MQKIALNVDVYAQYDGTNSLILVRINNVLVATKTLFGQYSRTQAEREWKMNRRTFKFRTEEQAQFLLKQI